MRVPPFDLGAGAPAASLDRPEAVSAGSQPALVRRAVLPGTAWIPRSVDAVEGRFVGNALDELGAAFLGLESLGLGDQAIVSVELLPGDLVLAGFGCVGLHGCTSF